MPSFIDLDWGGAILFAAVVETVFGLVVAGEEVARLVPTGIPFTVPLVFLVAVTVVGLAVVGLAVFTAVCFNIPKGGVPRRTIMAVVAYIMGSGVAVTRLFSGAGSILVAYIMGSGVAVTRLFSGAGSILITCSVDWAVRVKEGSVAMVAPESMDWHCVARMK